MKDEISAARRKKRRRYNLRRLLWLVVVVVLVIVSISVAQGITRTTFLDIGDFFSVLFKSGSYPVQLGSGAPLQAERMSMAYVVLTKNELMTYSSSGGQLLSAPHTHTAPCIAASSTRVVLYSVGSRDVTVYNRTEQLAEIQSENTVVSAGVANNGTVVLLTQSERYACQLDVYKSGGYTRTMVWYGEKGFPMHAVIRPDGRLAAAARVRASGGAVATVVAVIDLKDGRELYECEVPDLATDLYFDGEALLIVTDRGVLRVGADGAVAAQVDFGMVPLLSVARANGPVAVALGDNNRADINTVVVLDKNLNEQCRIEDCGVVRDMYVTGNRLYILGDRVISEYNLRGKLLRRYETDTDTVMVIDINGIVAIQPDSAKRVNTYIREE